MLERELRRLEALGQLLLDGVADDPLAGEPDERAGSAKTISPCMANDAVTPPVVGSVSTVMKGRRAAPKRSTAQDTFAICMSEMRPSCMRAPPEAQNTTTAAGLGDGAIDHRGHLLAHHVSHGAHEEAGLHDPYGQRQPRDGRASVRTASSRPLFSR